MVRGEGEVSNICKLEKFWHFSFATLFLLVSILSSDRCWANRGQTKYLNLIWFNAEVFLQDKSIIIIISTFLSFVK
jgi:hypothetical protein